MKFVNKKTILLFVATSLILGCTQTSSTNLPTQINSGNEINNKVYGTVKFNFDFPAKFVTKTTGFAVKSIDAGKINRIKLKIESATTTFTIERNVELVPGGISATLNLPLDKLYLVTVQGLNDTTNVSGSEIKGYFALKSSVDTPTVNINQASTSIARIIEALKPKFTAEAANAPKPVATVAPTPAPVASAGAFTPVSSATPVSTALTTTPVAAPYKLADIDLPALEDVVKRALGASHPSLLNITPFVDSIFKNKAVPVEVPANSLLKAGRIKGTISGLKYNEIAVITMGDPASKQTIVGTPSQVVSAKDTAVDADKTAPAIDFIIDNVSPGTWDGTAVASGYTITAASAATTVAAGADTALGFTFTPAQWLKAPNTISGNIGNSDQPSSALDAADNIHIVWRQDAFDTDTNSGLIFYSRWNGTSWTTQGVNISQYNDSNLRGSKDPAVSVGLDRLPHILWSGKDSTGARKIYYNSFNGITWQAPVAITGSQDGVTPSVIVDKTNGYLYAVWEAAGKIYLVQYDKTIWSNPIQVGSGTLPKITLGTDGIVHIVWKSDSVLKLQYASWTLAKGIRAVEDIPLGTHGSDTGNSIELAMDRFNRLHLVWRNGDYIQYILRSNVSWSLPEIVNELPTALLTAKSGASISISPTGIVNVAWVSPLQDTKEVIRYRRRLPDGWKQPFQKILDPSEVVTGTPAAAAATTIVKHSENIDGYEDIPLSQISAGVEGKPLIVTDFQGNTHVMWSNKGTGKNDTDLLHSVKTKAK